MERVDLKEGETVKYSFEDIVSQTFTAKWKGYATDEVDEFLGSLAHEWSLLVRDLAEAKSQNAQMRTEMRELRRRERGLHDSLQMAKQVSEELRERAEQEAQLRIREATTEAEALVLEAKQERDRLLQEVSELVGRRLDLEHNFRKMLERTLLDLNQGSLLGDECFIQPQVEQLEQGDCVEVVEPVIFKSEKTETGSIKRRPTGGEVSLDVLDMSG